MLNLRRDETALLCLLLLRGPQTPGELRSRADRLYSFDDLQAVVATLDRLAARASPEEEAESTGPLVTILPRQPGAREARFAHLLAGPVAEAIALPEARTAAPADGLATRVEALEQRLAELEERLRLLEGASGNRSSVSSSE